MAISFKNTKFVKTAIIPKDYPVIKDDSGRILPEIAVAGRSNVGKSSLLNHLFQEKKLVRTSSTPGKTQALNFFTVDKSLVFVDLPGYGFAQVPMAVRKQWGPMIQTYLEKRESLKLILFLFDIRRMPNDEDKQLLEWIAYHQKSAILVLTKVDKVNQSEREHNTRKILEAFNAENLHYIRYSVPKNVGRDKLLAMISEAIKEDN
jgi:GTP-binding protein